MTKPTHASAGGHAYLELQKLGKQRQRATEELLQLYVLERFLARLVESDFSKRLVLKGGVLLAAFDSRRPTKDVDFAARDFSNDLDTVRSAVATIVAINLDDGVVFDPGSIVAETIREDALYSGARISVSARLETARLKFHIDVNFGDPIYPAPSEIQLPTLLGEPIAMSDIHSKWFLPKSS